MAVAASPLDIEERRRRRISLALLIGILLGGVAIVNERALFDASGDFDQVAAAATVKELAAVVQPPKLWQGGDVAHLLPIHRAAEAVAAPMAPPVAFAAVVPPATDAILPASVTPGTTAAPESAGPLFASNAPTGDSPIIGPTINPKDPPISSSSSTSSTSSTSSSSSTSSTSSSSSTSSGGSGPPGDQPPSAVPEPATWGMLILGFGCVGGMLRLAAWRRGRTAARAS